MILIEKLLDNNHINTIKKQEIMKTLTLCLNQNYFEFDNKFYSSKEGLIMGNPLSPLLAEIFRDSLESIIMNHPLFKKFLYWYRYVDDVLTCFIGTETQLNQFIELINNLHPNIKFTIEREIDNSIDFLDLTIKKENNKHNFSIFHKPTHTDTTIHNSSNHPIQHKMAAFYSMIYRLISIPLQPIDFQKELNLIKQIATNNGYQSVIIDKILKQKNV